MQWIMHGGYREEHQYVDDTGRIVGWVSGSMFQANDGWHVVYDDVPRGRYVTLDQAKAAVESEYLSNSLQNSEVKHGIQGSHKHS